VRALTEDEEYYYVLLECIPEAFRTQGQHGRFGIHNRKTKGRKLALPPDYGGVRHRLNCRSDRGNVGWTQFSPMFALLDL